MSRQDQGPLPAGQTEDALKSLRLERARVEVHGDALAGWLARIEVPEEDLERALEPATREKIIATFKGLGFRFVTIDLAAGPPG